MSSIVLHKYNKQELLEIFKSFLDQSNFKIASINEEQNEVHINDGVRRFIVHFMIKNVSCGGWESKKNIYRIQVANVKDDLIPTNRVKTHMLIGIADYDGEYYLVVWNSYRYTKHNTQRSCYVNEESFEMCKEKGYILVRDFDQETWLCKKDKFSLLVRDYIEMNNCGEEICY